MNLYSISLRLLSFDGAYPILERVLLVHTEAANAAANSLSELAHEESDYADVIREDESEFLNALLGAAFVTCQQYITTVVSHVMLLHRRATSEGRHLTTTNGSKQSVIATCSAILPSCTVTEIEAINALANYFKHHDEWPADWATATGQSARTIGVITQLGAKQGTGVDLTTGLDQLGGDLRDVGKRIRAWQTNLHSAYTTELQTLGLI